MKRRSITRKVDIKGDTKLFWICAKEIVYVRLCKREREREREKERKGRTGERERERDRAKREIEG